MAHGTVSRRTLGDAIAQKQVEKKPVSKSAQSRAAGQVSHLSRLCITCHEGCQLTSMVLTWRCAASCGQVLDRRRLLATTAYATCFVGPIGHGWYSGLDWFARRHFAPRTLRFVGAKVSEIHCVSNSW